MQKVKQEQKEQCEGTCEACPSADPVTGECRKLPEKAKIDVKHVILVISGKGGVGKSTVSVNLAYALSSNGYRVALVDLDMHGPNIPKMLGIEDEKLQAVGDKIIPVWVTGNMAVISMALLLPDRDTPIIWRGPMKMVAIRQFLEDVDWGSLDYMVVDLPPGTGDEALTIAQIAPNVRGAIVVTTPQDVATLDSRKAARFVEKMGLKVIGIIENMSGFRCPHCNQEIDLFGTGGGRKAAEELGVPFLGTIPIDPDMRKAGDEGRPFIITKGDANPTWEHVNRVMEALVRAVEE